MHLIGSLASPFVQRCAIVARAKGFDIEIVPPHGGQIHSPEFQALAPMGRIPLLALDDGTHICESSAIAAYLEEALDGPGLTPASPRERARVREIEAIATLEIATGLRPVMVHRIFRVSENEPVVAAGIVQADRGCLAIERLMAADTRYALGDMLTPADAALVPIMQLAVTVADQPQVAAMLGRHPLLTAYLARAQRDPVLARSIAEIGAGFAAIRARLAKPQPA